MPLMHPYYKLFTPIDDGLRPLTSNRIPWWPYQLCLSYGWPTGLAGGGVIGIVELGGGWTQADVHQYFKYGNNHHSLPVPTITDVSVDSGVGNSPGTDADVEVALDIQIAGTAYAMA